MIFIRSSTFNRLHIPHKSLDLRANFSVVNNFTTGAASLSGVFVWVSEFFAFATSPGVGVVTVSFWVESTADEKFVVSLINSEWSVD